MAGIFAGKSKLSIELDQEAYYLDQAVTGRLCLDVTSKIEIYSLCIYMFGKEKIFMAVGRGDKKHHIKEVSNFLEQTHYLVGEAMDKGKPPLTTIPPGHYEYEFSLDFPADCNFPPSIEIGKCGMYYGLWGHVEDSGTWSANKKRNAKRKKSSQVKETFVPFTVVGNFLAEEPKWAPVNLTMMKKYLLNAKPLEINIKLARNLWLPGEEIQATATFNNQTGKKVKYTEMFFQPYIFQKVGKKEFNRRMPALYSTKQEDCEVPGNCTRQFDFSIQSELELFPTLDSPQLLHYTHVLLFRVHISGEPFLDIAVPIIVLCNVEKNKKLIDDARAAAAAVKDYGAEELEKDSEGCCVIM